MVRNFVAVLALAGAATSFSAFSTMTESEIGVYAEVGALTGSVKMKLERISGADEAYYAARAWEVAREMGCGTPSRVFRRAGAHEKKHELAGFHLWYEAACTASREVFRYADATVKSKAIDAGAEVAAAFSRLGRSKSPMAASATAALTHLAPGFVVKTHGYLREGAEAERDLRAAGKSPVPDDARYDQQTNYEIMDIEGAWELFPPAGNPDVVIQVVDTGLFMTHEEFQSGNLWTNPGEICGNGIDDDDNGYVDDCHGYNHADDVGNDELYGGHFHGTHCAGTIAATRNNGVGIAGICGGDGRRDSACRIMVNVGFGYTQTAGFADAILYGADNGAHVSSNSWGYTTPGTKDQDELDAIDYATAAGVLVVFAAGNDSTSGNMYPGFYAPTIAVAAVDDTGRVASFSNYGDWIEVSAPGVGVLSTVIGNFAYDVSSGTSFSCPTVAGLFGLCLSANPYLARDEVTQCLYSTSLDVDDEDNAYGNSNKYWGKLGYGVPQAVPFMQCCMNAAPTRSPTVSPAPTTPAPSPAPSVTFSPTPYGCGRCDLQARLLWLTDDYPDEQAWSLEMVNSTDCRHDASARSDDEDREANTWQIAEFDTLCEEREYRLVFTDSNGDGLCCNSGLGEIKFEIEGEIVWSVSGYDAFFDILDVPIVTATYGSRPPTVTFAPTLSPTVECKARTMGFGDKIGNGDCDATPGADAETDIYNNPGCGWDGGDCCLCTCQGSDCGGRRGTLFNFCFDPDYADRNDDVEDCASAWELSGIEEGTAKVVSASWDPAVAVIAWKLPDEFADEDTTDGWSLGVKYADYPDDFTYHAVDVHAKTPGGWHVYTGVGAAVAHQPSGDFPFDCSITYTVVIALNGVDQSDELELSMPHCPEDCSDSATWAYKSGKDCEWISKNTDKCDKKDDAGDKAKNACQRACDNCDTYVPDDVCLDSTSWFYQDGRDCEYIAKNTDKCDKEDDAGEAASDACPLACDTCPEVDAGGGDDCVDSDSWALTNGNDCAWVAESPSAVRCDRVDADGVLASDACAASCGTC